MKKLINLTLGMAAAIIFFSLFHSSHLNLNEKPFVPPGISFERIAPAKQPTEIRFSQEQPDLFCLTAPSP